MEQAVFEPKNTIRNLYYLFNFENWSPNKIMIQYLLLPYDWIDSPLVLKPYSSHQDFVAISSRLRHLSKMS